MRRHILINWQTRGYKMNNAYKLKKQRAKRDELITTILCTIALSVIVVASWVVIYESFIYRYGA